MFEITQRQFLLNPVAERQAEQVRERAAQGSAITQRRETGETPRGRDGVTDPERISEEDEREGVTYPPCPPST